MEDLHRGAPYDLDLEEGEGQGEELEAEAMGVTRRRTLNACYHNILLQQPDYFWSKAQVNSQILCLHYGRHYILLHVRKDKDSWEWVLFP